MKKILPCGCHMVSDRGEVFSKIHQYSEKGHQGVITKLSNKWQKLNPCLTVKGYRQISIHGRIVRLNRLIASNFVDNPMSYPEVQHKNGDKENNKAVNLKWGNQKHNAEDREKHGNSVHGVKYPRAKLTDEKVIEIRGLRDSRTLQSLADEYKVSKKLILLVVQRKIWRHVI